MNDLRKAAEMALEALEDIFGKEKKDVGAINALRQALNVDAVNMTAECVDETVKGEHIIDCTDEQLIEEVRRRGFVIRDAQIGREWVGLDGEIPGLGLVTEEFYNGMLFAEDYLREKNGG